MRNQRVALIVAAGVLLLAALGAGLGIALTRHAKPVARATPAATPTLESPTPEETVSPSPCNCPTPSPTPGPSKSTSAPAGGGCGSAPPGGFPGGSMVVSDGSAARYPTALAWAPDGRLFWTIRGGSIGVYQGGGIHVFATIGNVSTSGERGLLGLAISPTFSRDRHVFAFFSRSDDPTLQEVIRFTDCGGVGTAPTPIITNLPAGAASACCHKGGRIAFGPDGKLYVTIGDNYVPNEAQSTGSLRGKVLRYNPDGSAAPGNPFGNPVWTYGLRNPFGIALAPDGTLAVTNNGPSGDDNTPCGTCGDIFDLVGKAGGVDYQWPFCWGYSHPFNGNIDCHGTTGPGYSAEGGPYAKSNPFFAVPTGVTWVSSGRFANHFVFCEFSGGNHMFEYMGPQSVADTGLGNCGLDVKQGPDGALYSSDASTIYRQN